MLRYSVFLKCLIVSSTIISGSLGFLNSPYDVECFGLVGLSQGELKSAYESFSLRTMPENVRTKFTCGLRCIATRLGLMLNEEFIAVEEVKPELLVGQNYSDIFTKAEVIKNYDECKKSATGVNGCDKAGNFLQCFLDSLDNLPSLPPPANRNVSASDQQQQQQQPEQAGENTSNTTSTKQVFFPATADEPVLPTAKKN